LDRSNKNQEEKEMTEHDLRKAIQDEAGSLSTDAVENTFQHLERIISLSQAMQILVKR